MSNILSRRMGFTLIELSIVLVIIGLIVGGVLVGRDLIQAASIRASISQLEQYEAAANTFRVKYNGLPGDLPNAGMFGFSNTNQFDMTGNGLINRTTSYDIETAAQWTLRGESALFFRHLFQAGLIKESITITDGNLWDDGVGDVTIMLPPFKLGKGNYVVAETRGGMNELFVGGMEINDGAYFYDKITPVEAFQMDSKMDDGAATTGKMIAMSSFTTVNTDDGAATAGDCVSGTAYYTSSTITANVNGCLFARRASF